MLGDSAMLPVAGGKSGLKPQGTVTHPKQWRVDQKKYPNPLIFLQTNYINTFLPTDSAHVRYDVAYAAVP